MFHSLTIGKGSQPIAKVYKPNANGEDNEEKKTDKTDKIKKRSILKNVEHKLPHNTLYINELETSDETAPREFFIKGSEKMKPYNIRQSQGHANRIFCAGGTLCGKSYMAGKLARSYQRFHPNNKVILFSWVDDDEAYKKIKDIHKIRIDDTILNEPIELDELHDSICIFDDIEHFTDPYIIKELERLRDSCINAGRHKNIDVIIARQNLLDGPKTKTALNSSFQVIAFPHSAGRYQLAEMLRRYMAMDKQTINKILNVPSRWVLINRATPPYILHEKGAFLL